MKAVLSHLSALEFWRSALSDMGSAREQSRTRRLPENAPLAQDMADYPLVRSGALSLPVHVLASESRRSGAALAIHRTQPLPAGSLRRVVLPGSDETAFATCPELTFVQMAPLLRFPRAVNLGYELCGTFAPDENRPYGVRSREPLTSPEKLASYLAKAGGMRGAKAARSALPHILGGSASPRESTLAELLTLPCRRGGSNLAPPSMNAVVTIPTRCSWASDRSSFRCDLLWRDKGVAVEYDSTLCHTGAERIAHDAARRNVLESLGLTVVTATWRQVANFREYNRFAHILAGHLGAKIRPSCADYPSRQFALRRELLGPAGPFSR